MVLPLCLGDGMKMLYLRVLTVKCGVSRGVNDQIRSSRLAHIRCSKHTYSEAKPIGITTTKTHFLITLIPSRGTSTSSLLHALSFNHFI